MATGRWQVEDYGMLKLTLENTKGDKYGAYSGLVVGKIVRDSATSDLFRDGAGAFPFTATRSRLQISHDGTRYSYRRKRSA